MKMPVGMGETSGGAALVEAAGVFRWLAIGLGAILLWGAIGRAR